MSPFEKYSKYFSKNFIFWWLYRFSFPLVGQGGVLAVWGWQNCRNREKTDEIRLSLLILPGAVEILFT